MFPEVRLAALVAACLISTGALAKTIVLRAATVLDMTGAPAHRADVVLDGERIAAVLPEGRGRGDRIIDLTGKSAVVTGGLLPCNPRHNIQQSAARTVAA